MGNGLDRILKNFFIVVVNALTVGCTSMGSVVPFPNDELQETSTSSHSFVPFTTQTYQYDLEGVETKVTYGQGEYKDSSNFPSTDTVSYTHLTLPTNREV